MPDPNNKNRRLIAAAMTVAAMAGGGVTYTLSSSKTSSLTCAANQCPHGVKINNQCTYYCGSCPSTPCQ